MKSTLDNRVFPAIIKEGKVVYMSTYKIQYREQWIITQIKEMRK